MRKLTEAEIDAYDVLPRPVARRVRIQRVPLLARGSSGMTLGRFIFLRRDDQHDGTRKLIAHELVHVRQYHELGLVRFLFRYLRSYFSALARVRAHRKAYHAISFEEQAYKEADEWELRQPGMLQT